MNTTTNLRSLAKDTGGDGKPVAFVLPWVSLVWANVGRTILNMVAMKSNEKRDTILKS